MWALGLDLNCSEIVPAGRRQGDRIDQVRLGPLAGVLEHHQLKRSELSFMLLRVSCERMVAKPVHRVRAV
jgi:hypothetical protein